MRSFNTFASRFIFGIFLTGGCLPSPPEGQAADRSPSSVFDHERSAREEIVPAFVANGSASTARNPVCFLVCRLGNHNHQILQGAPADVRYLDRARCRPAGEGKAVTHDFHQSPYKGIINKTPFVILVRKGNPKGIQDFPTLQTRVQIIHPTL